MLNLIILISFNKIHKLVYMIKRTFLFSIHLYFTLILFAIPVSSVNGQNIRAEDIVGEWHHADYDNGFHFFFFLNSRYKESLNSIDFSKAFGKVKYKIISEMDTSWLILRYKKMHVNGSWVKNFVDRKVIWLNGDYLTVALYKKGLGINNHIDEYSVLVRKKENPKKAEYTGKRINYVIPEGFTGSVWIAFNQPKGSPPEYDSIGNPILIIPSSGLLETTLPEDVFATANRYYNIWGKVNSEKEAKVFKSFDKFDRIDTTTIKPDELYAFVGGFNQTSRSEINEIFQKPISGNVLTIFIGKMKWFVQYRLHPWDSKRE